MSEVAPIGTGQIDRVSGLSSVGRDAHRTEESSVRRGSDYVEVSPVATYLSKLKQLPIRQDLVDTVRDQIYKGTYDTPEKLDVAVSELLGDL